MFIAEQRHTLRRFASMPLAMLCLLPLTAIGTTSGLADDAPTSGTKVFRGSVDVSVINLYVTVLDRDGRPVADLSADDFEILEQGRRVELTNFSVLHSGLERRLDADPARFPERASPANGRHVALLLDLPSLQKRNRRRVCQDLEPFVREVIGDGGKILLATNRGELKVVREFTDYEASAVAALRTIPDMEPIGDGTKRSRRYLRRSVFQTDYFKVSRNVSGNMEVDTAQATSMMQMTYNEIETVRRTEFNRIAQALRVADELVRAMAGLDGPKTVLWVGEDLALRPAYDLYSAFYRKTAFLRAFTNFAHPDAWAQELSLSREFERLAANAQASGASFHIIDASDRDREMNTADYSPPSVDSIIANEATGDLWTPGTDFADLRDVTEGGSYLALATGGSSHGNTRDLGGALGTIREQLNVTYSLGYTRPGPPDGRRRSVKVRVTRPGLRVRHHEKVLNRTSIRELSDKALSRARFDLGTNPHGLVAELGEPVRSDDDPPGQSVRELRLTMPIESVTLLPDGDQLTGSLVAAVAVLDARNRAPDPRLLRLSMAIPAERYQPGARGAQSFQLRLEDDVQRIAVGLQDEISGVISTTLIDLAGPTADPEPDS